MANRVYIVDGVLYEETGERVVIVDGVVLEETTSVAPPAGFVAAWAKGSNILINANAGDKS